MNENESVINYVDEDNALKRAKELYTAAQQGVIQKLAARVYFKDGTYKDIVGGYNTEEERLAMLADLQRKISTKSN